MFVISQHLQNLKEDLDWNEAQGPINTKTKESF